MTTSSIKIGTRGSQLALWQANWVKDQIISHHPDTAVEICIIKTKGDKILDTPLAKIGGKGLFVKEIEDALLTEAVDLAVHSMKDMPGKLPEGLIIGAVPKRETPFDALISRDKVKLSDLPHEAKVGTSSLRRSAQLLNLRPDLTIVPLRGNVDTRLAKLAKGEMDAIILAAAGLTRLGFADQITEYIDSQSMLPAVAQGALCIEIRQTDTDTAALLAPLDHPGTHLAITAERAFLQRLEGGCQVPIAAQARVNGDDLDIDGLVADLDGRTVIRNKVFGSTDEADRLGVKLAEDLLADGAGEILKTLLEAAE